MYFSGFSWNLVLFQLCVTSGNNLICDGLGIIFCQTYSVSPYACVSQYLTIESRGQFLLQISETLSPFSSFLSGTLSYKLQPVQPPQTYLQLLDSVRLLWSAWDSPCLHLRLENVSRQKCRPLQDLPLLFSLLLWITFLCCLLFSAWKHIFHIFCKVFLLFAVGWLDQSQFLQKQKLQYLIFNS